MTHTPSVIATTSLVIAAQAAIQETPDIDQAGYDNRFPQSRFVLSPRIVGSPFDFPQDEPTSAGSTDRPCHKPVYHPPLNPLPSREGGFLYPLSPGGQIPPSPLVADIPPLPWRERVGVRGTPPQQYPPPLPWRERAGVRGANRFVLREIEVRTGRQRPLL